MSCKYQEHLTLGIQFIFDLSTNKIKTRTVDSSIDLEIYKITPKGRKFVGKGGLVDILWLRCLDLLCENTIETVTFYSESYTKAMMPDRIAGNLSDLMIAYSRVFKSLKELLNLTENSVTVGLNRYWIKRIDYSTKKPIVPPPTYKSSSLGNIYKDQQVLFYPFLFKPNYYPDILRYYDDINLEASEKLHINDGYTIENNNSFPNIELKPDLDQDVSSNNIDPFNILL